MLTKIGVGVLTLIVIVVCVLSAKVHAIDARVNIDRAVELIEAESFSLARAYLQPALIDPRISAAERSRGYYLRGYSFLAQEMVVSALKDYHRALEFNANNPTVLLGLGRLYSEGRGTRKNPETGFLFYERAAALGYDRAQFQVGRAYLFGQGVAKNVEAARTAFLQAAKQEHLLAMLNLAASYRRGYVADAQPELALSWYNKAHVAGAPAALLSIGFMYANSELGQPQPEVAVQYYRQALDAGFVPAAVHLAYAHLTGEGAAVDVERAKMLYQRAAEAAIPAAYLGLGHLYETGAGVNKDLDLALQWYGKAADVNEPVAFRRLVDIYLAQEGEAARALALKWSRRAAQLGGASAHNTYAWLLATSKSAALRNGALALDQANKAVEADSNAAYLDTLAAAHAELGEFALAIAVQRRAIDAVGDVDGGVKDELEQRLEAYQRSQPWRE